ncbi:MAG TPA: aminotransferase class I/II-fold pyridoxal phosphate-dependent enzyme [Anaerolineae bacterium]|nr:aminotransferase class I/II-fold pyridoxal phosphate-dependent enzyme [Anaerolineae bacterium]
MCAPTPLQAAALAALDLPERYYAESLRAYHGRRALMMAILRDVGFAAREPEGAYYVMADYTGLNAPQAQLKPMPFAQWLTSEVGVAVVPGDSFYSLPGYGVGIVRFAFPKKLATLEAAGERLRAKLA